MGTVSRTYTYSAGAVIIAAQHNTNENTLYNVVNGNLDTNNLSSSAAILDTQLATITTAGKVNTNALTTSSQAAGDILYNTGTAWTRLAIGSPGQNLVVNGGGTAPSWAGSAGVTGQITMWGGAIASPPSGWLVCDGSVVSQVTYAALYAVIGHKWASDPGSGNFTLPNFTNVFPYGASEGTSAGNASVGSRNAAPGTGGAYSGNDNSVFYNVTGSNDNGAGGTPRGIQGNNGTPGAGNNMMMPYTAVSFIIKT